MTKKKIMIQLRKNENVFYIVVGIQSEFLFNELPIFSLLKLSFACAPKLIDIHVR